MKLISWNVAGIRACYKKGFLDFFNRMEADIVCLQEVKALESEIPFEVEGYYHYLNCAEKKGYSGTLIYTKEKPISVSYGMQIEKHDHEGRIVTLEYPNFYLVNVYVPNVKRDLSRLDYRMEWEDDFRTFLKHLEETKPVICCGDFNVAHTEMDIKNAKGNIGNAGFTDEERSKFTELLNSGFIDSFRYLNPDAENRYTWWSYMGKARINNVGWRIDYFILSNCIKEKLEDAMIYSDVYGSDHCPIGIEVSF